MNWNCCPSKVLPAIVHPTKCCTNHSCQNYVVPHIHPSHTTNINHEFYAHQHYYPHTESFANEVNHQHFNAGPGPGPVPGPGFGPMSGPMPGPRPFWGR